MGCIILPCFSISFVLVKWNGKWVWNIQPISCWPWSKKYTNHPFLVSNFPHSVEVINNREQDKGVDDHCWWYIWSSWLKYILIDYLNQMIRRIVKLILRLKMLTNVLLSLPLELLVQNHLQLEFRSLVLHTFLLYVLSLCNQKLNW